MIARLSLPDAEVKSKQHSRAYAANGRTFTDREYAAARNMLYWTAKTELAKQGWMEPVECRCAMRISYRGRFDLDNAAGFVMDALQGAAYLRDSQLSILGVRKRTKGAMGIAIIIHTLGGLR